MSEYEHSEMEVDEQSEDGELLKSPLKTSPMQLSKEDALFTISDEENDTGDSLDIKPPQAIVYHKTTSRPGSSRRDKHSERESRRDHSSHSHGSAGKADPHRKTHRHLREHREHRQEERGREKHRHRERREAAQRDGKHERSESSHQSRDREQRNISEGARTKDKPDEGRAVAYEGGSRSKDKGDRLPGEQRNVYESSSRPAKEKSEKVDRSMEDLRDQRAAYDSSRAKEKGERSEKAVERPADDRGGYEQSRSKVDRVLEDLRERLLDKRRGGGEGREGIAPAMSWDDTHAGGGPDRRGKLEARERHRRGGGEEGHPPAPPPARDNPREKAERTEREMRRERLLEAEEGMMSEPGSGTDSTYRIGSPCKLTHFSSIYPAGRERRDQDREMVRQKEVYRRELEARRERRHMERERERTMRQIVKKRERSRDRKRLKVADDKGKGDQDKEAGEDCQVVTVSDTSEHSDDRNEEKEEAEEEEEEEEGSADEENAEEESSEEEEEDSETESNEEAGDTDESPGGLTGDEKDELSPPLTDARKRSPSPDARAPTPPSKPAEPPEEDGDRNGGADDPTVVDSPKSDVGGAGAERLPPYLPAVSGCRSVEEFQCLNRIEEGTYGVVYRARDKRTEEVVALKRLKMEKEKEGFPITSLREINTLLKAQHPNIVTVREIVVGSNMDKIFIVMDYVEHDLKSLMETMKQKKQVFIPGEVKCLMQQLLRAVTHLHDNWILHRDLKTSNLLLSHKGILKVGDFGLAREYGSPLKGYTPIVVTLWYRSPELLLCTKEYSTPIDLWSVGCIFGEFLSMEALFPGKSEVDQLNRIFKDLGTPNEKVWPGYSKLPAVQKMTFTEFPAGNLRKRFGTMITESGMDLMNKFLTYDPEERVTAEDALKHGYFRELPLAIDPAMFPTWPAKSELGHRKAAASPKPPPGGMHYKQLGDADDDLTIGGFHMGGGAMENRRASHVGGGFSLKF